MDGAEPCCITQPSPGTGGALLGFVPSNHTMEQPLQGTPMAGNVLQDCKVQLRVYPTIFDSPCFPQKKNQFTGAGNVSITMSCSDNIVLLEMPRYGNE